jgi:hypothetical protein
MSGKILGCLVRSSGSLALAALCMAPLDAIAGNLWLTGHDMDFHCAGGSGCNTLGIAMNFVRQGAPTKTLPILVLDEGGEVASAAAQPGTTARNTVEGAGMPFPLTVVNPTTAAFATTVISTTNFSAIVIASDSSCGGCDNTAASIAAINARTAELQAFFTAGGGILYNSGAGNRATYYNSVPIPATAAAVSPPFVVTAAGAALGMLLADANCCATHNSFTLPAPGSPLIVAETDSIGQAETLFVSGGSICGGTICGAGGSLDIPTLSEWSMILMSALLALSAVIILRRRRR